ncbi:MAG TPA: SPFH domain-containing protein [Opitutaceae bacterium]|nr:SPFH domain-containing protein [Opitutaceae bacterium]
MVSIIAFTALAIVALAFSVVNAALPKAAKALLRVIAILLFVVGLMIGSSVVVDNSEVGIVVKLYGSSLPTGDIIARNGEAGPQAGVLMPGYHFGYWPFLYEVKHQPVITIRPGEVGFVSARDGRSLPEGSTFAPEWPSTKDMMDAVKFLSPNGGYRGPQTSVLTPATYRFNTALFDVTPLPALSVSAGTVTVIKSNTGAVPSASDGEIESVNGVPLVKKGFRGVWAEPMLPGTYYLNTKAYEPIVVKTTQRVYTYQALSSTPRARAGQKAEDPQDWAVAVRTKDGFTFPVDVRVVCAIEAKNAPHLVALLGNPDAVVKDDQESEQLEVLEAKVILPSIRAIFRNEAESKGALEFVAGRSEIEAAASKAVTAELAKSKITVYGVFLGNIHLDVTDAGRTLIQTQTDKEVALNQQKLYTQQQLAEKTRADLVRAKEQADQQKNLAAAEFSIDIQKAQANAAIERARGEAKALEITGEGRANAYRKLVESLGRDQVAQIELLKLVVDGRVRITPDVMVSSGGANGINDALAGTLLRNAASEATAAARGASTTNPAARDGASSTSAK